MFCYDNGSTVLILIEIYSVNINVSGEGVRESGYYTLTSCSESQQTFTQVSVHLYSTVLATSLSWMTCLWSEYNKKRVNLPAVPLLNYWLFAIKLLLYCYYCADTYYFSSALAVKRGEGRTIGFLSVLWSICVLITEIFGKWFFVRTKKTKTKYPPPDTTHTPPHPPVHCLGYVLLLQYTNFSVRRSKQCSKLWLMEYSVCWWRLR